MFKEKLNTLKATVNYFQLNSIITIKGDNLKFINGKIYEYVIDNSIKVYDSKTFKPIGILKLPFERKQQTFDLLENDVLIILGNTNLYFYKIDLKENKLKFLHYISDIDNFCYLKKRKEIFLLTRLGSYKKNKKIWGRARTDLLGNIIYYKKKKPKIHSKYKPPKKEDNKGLCAYRYDYYINFNKFDGFNNDYYIINVSGYINDWYDYKIGFGDKDIVSDISVFNVNNLNEIFYEKHEFSEVSGGDYEDSELLDYEKISDNLFKYLSKEGIFYYNEKEKKIENIDNIFNNVSKSFISYYKNNNNINLDNNELQLYHNYYSENESYKDYYRSKSEFDYFYLDDNTFGIFVNYKEKKYLYIIYLSEGNVKKVDLNCLIDKDEKLIIKNIFYSKINEKENLYIFVSGKNVKRIVYGIVTDKKNESG